jgi:hypothetical protein
MTLLNPYKFTSHLAINSNWKISLEVFDKKRFPSSCYSNKLYWRFADKCTVWGYKFTHFHWLKTNKPETVKDRKNSPPFYVAIRFISRRVANRKALKAHLGKEKIAHCTLARLNKKDEERKIDWKAPPWMTYSKLTTTIAPKKLKVIKNFRS